MIQNDPLIDGGTIDPPKDVGLVNECRFHNSRRCEAVASIRVCGASARDCALKNHFFITSGINCQSLNYNRNYDRNCNRDCVKVILTLPDHKTLRSGHKLAGVIWTTCNCWKSWNLNHFLEISAMALSPDHFLIGNMVSLSSSSTCSSSSSRGALWTRSQTRMCLCIASLQLRDRQRLRGERPGLT